MNDIMVKVGHLIFMILSAKYRNDPDEYLALMKLDRLEVRVGFNPSEFGEWIKSKESEQGFLNNIDKKPSEMLLEIKNQRNVTI